jgi:hypothetical protein
MAHQHRHQKSRYCGYCDRMRLSERQEPNNLLHFVLTVLTCGLWLPVWFVLAVVTPAYRCQRCGSKV